MYSRDYIIRKIQYWEDQLEKAHRVPTNWEDQTPVQRFYQTYHSNMGPRRPMNNWRSRRSNGY